MCINPSSWWKSAANTAIDNPWQNLTYLASVAAVVLPVARGYKYVRRYKSFGKAAKALGDGKYGDAIAAIAGVSAVRSECRHL